MIRSHPALSRCTSDNHSDSSNRAVEMIHTAIKQFFRLLQVMLKSRFFFTAWQSCDVAPHSLQDLHILVLSDVYEKLELD